MIKFPSIEQFRNVVRAARMDSDYRGKDDAGSAIYQHDKPYPELFFLGTVKLHGTNAAIVKYKDRIEYQSRERVLDLQHDNHGFMLNMLSKDLTALFGEVRFEEHCAFFGEWCGSGIQSGVAISGLPKMFCIFALNVDGRWYETQQSDHSQQIYNVKDFGLFGISVNFNNPEEAQNTLIETTNQVEGECPAGKFFGVNGVGEGVVWTAKYRDEFYRFKVKGEKHSVSKVKTLASVDVEQVRNMEDFADQVITDSRLSQAVDWLVDNGKPLDQTSTGDFLRWIYNDVVKEEQDTIVANQLDPKKLGSVLSKKAREWWFKRLDSFVGNPIL